MTDFRKDSEEDFLSSELAGDALQPATRGEVNAVIKAITGLMRSVTKIREYFNRFKERLIIDGDGRIWRVLAQEMGYDPRIADEGPLTLYRAGGPGEIGIRWGLVNGLVPGNINTVFDASSLTYFFIKAGLSNPTSRFVVDAEIVTSGAPNGFWTANFQANIPPTEGYFLLGYADQSGFVNAGRGNLEFHAIVSHMYSEAGALHARHRIAVYRTG